MVLVERLDVAELEAGRVGRADGLPRLAAGPSFAARRRRAVYPLTQATFSLTAESPRKCAVVPVGVSCHS